ncbi:hypothetical protein [Lachnospira sp.]|jgi:hypothetical protein|uniref:hypothetical protein n=1 Tax=Lachnospira sp. TaxID=2049031 RepID=UPI002579ACBB|nr:hypothetical protein [Lachnospira sp.]
MKQFNELKFTDDFMFSKVMRKKDICKEFLELVLDKKIEKIEYIEAEKTLDIDYDKAYVNQIRTIMEKEGVSIDEALIKLDIPEKYWNAVKRELLINGSFLNKV